VNVIAASMVSGGVLRHVRRVPGGALLLGALFTLSSPCAAQVAVDRLEIVFQTKSGDPRLGVINLRNDGAQTLQALVRFEDWDRTEGGISQWYPQGTLPSSCASRMQLFPASVSLDPGATQAVRVLLDSAATISKECWSAVVVETVPPRVEGGRTISYIVRTAIKIYVEPQALHADGEIADLRIQPKSTAGSDSVDVLFHNSGEKHLETSGTIEFRRPDNSVAAKLELPTLYTLPAAKSRARVGVPALPPGRYIVLALLDFGGDQIAAAQSEYEVVP
jgi:P pilus assembly chaperone PapD